MDWRREFIIQFEGLKEGVHHFNFEVGDAFFAGFEGSLVDRSDLKVSLELEKKSTMMVLDFSVGGVIIRECDRCGDPLEVPMDFKQQLFVKYGEEEADADDNIVFIPQSAFELDVAPYIYESVVLELPLRNVHPEGQCNEAATKILDDMNTRAESKIDPRWNKLKDLKTDN